MGKIKMDEWHKLREKVVQDLAWGNLDQWHHSMFNEWSDLIFKASEVRLSATTLKRFMGVVQHDGNPSITTLDAIASSLGYENYFHFKQTRENKAIPFKLKVSSQWMYGLLGISAVVVFLVIMVNVTASVTPVQKGDVPFESKVLAYTYPNSVVFDFDLENLRGDSFKIQQYWDPTKTIDLKKGQKQATGIYYRPGYFRSKLLVDGEIVKEHDLFLLSNGWMGSLEFDPVPMYFQPNYGEFGLSYPEEVEREILTSDDYVVSTYHFVDDLGNVSGDHFAFTGLLKNTYNEKWAVCEAANIYILGTEGAMIIPVSVKGCSSKMDLKVNEKYYSGREHDLSALSSVLSKGTKIQIENRDKHVKVSFDDRIVLEDTYAETMGKFVGLRIKFLGLGEVGNLEVFDQEGKKVAIGFDNLSAL